MQIDYKHALLNLLSQDANFQTNKKLIQILGKNLADFLTYLLEESKIQKKKEFPSTNFDICLFAGMKLGTISQCKKLGEKMELFELKEKDFPKITYYILNYKKIYELLSTPKSIKELAYERMLREASFSEAKEVNINRDSLKTLGFRKLRIFCKKEGISYSGNDTKEDLIQKILENKEVV